MRNPLFLASAAFFALVALFSATGTGQQAPQNDTDEIPAAKKAAKKKKVVPAKPYEGVGAIPARGVLVELLEGMADEWTWDFIAPAPSERFEQRELAFVELPRKY